MKGKKQARKPKTKEAPRKEVVQKKRVEDKIAAYLLTLKNSKLVRGIGVVLSRFRNGCYSILDIPRGLNHLIVGVDRQVLAQCTEGEKVKYSVLGGLILLVSLFASLSGFYAISLIMDDLTCRIGIAVLWGCFILCLDRALITTAPKKKHVEIKGDLKLWEKGWQFFIGHLKNMGLGFFIRLMFVFIIAIVVSKPIELKILEREVDQYLFEKKEGKVDGLKAKTQEIEKEYAPKILAAEARIRKKESERPEDLKRLEEELEKLEQKRDEKQDEIDRKNEKLERDIRFIETQILKAKNIEDFSKASSLRKKRTRREDDIKANKRKIIPDDNKIKKKEQEIKRRGGAYQKELDALRKRENADIERWVKEKNERIAKADASTKEGEQLFSNNGILARIDALEKAAEHNPTVGTVSWILMLLFMAIELAPMLTKSFMARSLYDELLELKERDLIAQKIEKLRTYQEKLAKAEMDRELEKAERLELAQRKQEVEALEHTMEQELKTLDTELLKKAKEDDYQRAKLIKDEENRLKEEEERLSNEIELAEKNKIVALLKQEELEALSLQQSINQVKLEQETLNNKAILKAVSDAHLSIVKEQVEMWMEKERQNLMDNFDADRLN